ncbi:GDNF/GAS1, partial [Trinorchestia longiramus]
MVCSHQCLAAWIKLKMSPMFGCICPNDNQKQECSQIFDMVHQNPCVDELPAFNAPNLIMVSGTDTVGEETLWSVMYPPSAPTSRPRTRPHVHHYSAPHLSAPHLSAPLPPALPPHHYSNRMVPSNINGNSPPYYPYLPPSVHVVTPAPVTPPPYLTAPPPLIYAAQTQNVLSVAVPSSSTVEGNPLWSFAVNVLPRDNDSTSLRRTDGSVMNPLIAPPYSATPGGGSLTSGRTLGQSGNSLPSAGGDNSRAASVLGNWYAKTNQVPGLSSSSASAAASVAGNAQHSLSASRRDPAVMMQKTCQTSLVECLGDRKCKRLMDGVLATCDANQCSQAACMDNLQKFYRNVDTKWAMDVAFCLCKLSSQTADACLAAQEQLHPTCARKPYGPMPLCHKIASSCKHDASCRHRLEFYEQACAVDSDTQRCAGSTSECRRAMTGILGTELRVLCTCASLDIREHYVCVDWQRILWFNPCVVESQTDYHRVMLQSMSPGVELTTSPNIIYPPRLTTEVLSEPVHQSGGSSQQAHLGGSVFGVTRAAENTWQPPTLPPTTTTTRRPTTTTMPPNFCEKHYPSRGKVDYIVEGGGKRFYTVSDPSCSELCLCHAGKKLVCNVLQCVEARPCATSVAIYIHAAPAFMAYRGECLCYSGNFICVRPEHTMYDAGEGLFLFVGFSQAEEELLNPYTHLSVVDSVPRLQVLLEEAAVAVNESHCELALQEQLGQNLIFRVTLPALDEHRDNLTTAMLNREKTECMDSLKMLAYKINTQHEDVKSDIVLSMFMLAQVHSNVPDMPAVGATAQASGVLVSLLCIATLSLQ